MKKAAVEPPANRGIRILVHTAVVPAMLIGLPLAGVMLTGRPAADFLEFPPRTRYVSHAGFSWLAFVIYGLLILTCVLPFVRQLSASLIKRGRRLPALRPFPWWGWLGLALGLGFWILAWSRWDWFAPLQPHTFTPLWLGYILVVNGLCYRRTGRCPLRDHPRWFAALFPVSVLFWWFFEYLNRFVQNWSYSGVHHFSAVEYLVYASICFATVLPAVLSTRAWLADRAWLKQALGNVYPLGIPCPRAAAAAILLIAAGGLALIGIWPNYLFSLLWLAPLLIWLAVLTLMGESHPLSPVTSGDWSGLAASALAALVCGFFWEMWNYFSLARWTYSIPHVQRFHIFEMPMLGYAGYLPFGLECALIGELLQRYVPSLQK